MSHRFKGDFPIDHSQWREASQKTGEHFVSSLHKAAGQTNHSRAGIMSKLNSDSRNMAYITCPLKDEITRTNP